MKGGLSRFRWKGRDLSLILIVLLCATILTWLWPAWNKIVASSYTHRVRTLHISSVSLSKTEGEPKDSHKSENKPITMGEGNEVAENRGNMTKSDGTESSLLRDKKLEREENGEISPSEPEEPKHSQEPLQKQITKGKESEGSCTYTKGKWILHDRKPLYSGFGCKQWLAPMWACRLTQRQDFAYEKLRWQPKDCQMEEFEAHVFLKRMQHKTLAFVGDSLGRQQFQSLMCMIAGGNESSNVMDVGKEYGFVIPPGGKRPSGWAYRFPSTNTTVLYYWSASLCDLEPLNVSDPNTEYAMHLDRPPAFLQQFLHKIDVLVLNTGHHWNRGKLRANRWVMYIGGAPLTDRRMDIGGAKNLTIHSIVKWVNSQLPQHPHLQAFYRSISPRHFVHGEWNTGGSCNNTTPMSIGKELLQEESIDSSAASAVRGTRVKLLDISALSQLRDEAHISRYSITSSSGFQDCLHWCLPGVPDTWNEILFAQLQPHL